MQKSKIKSSYCILIKKLYYKALKPSNIAIHPNKWCRWPDGALMKMEYTYPITKREIVKLPSTSPANAKFTLDKLIDTWKCIKGK